MAVRSRRLVGPVAVGAGNTTLYTVPAGRTLIIHAIHWWKDTGGAVIQNLEVNGVPFAQISTPTQAASGTVPNPVYLNPGDTLIVQCLAALVNVNWLIGGSLLLGVPT